MNITGAGAWQQRKQPTNSIGIGNYIETSTVHENQPSVSVFGSTPNTNYTRIDSQESITWFASFYMVPKKEYRVHLRQTVIKHGHSEHEIDYSSNFSSLYH